MAPSKMSFATVLLVAFATPSAAFSFPAIFPCLPFLPRIPLFPAVRRADAAGAGAEGVPDAAAEDDAVRWLPHRQQREARASISVGHGRSSHLLLPRRQRRRPAAPAGADELHADVLLH